MLSNEEILLFQAVKDEEDRQNSMIASGLLGAGLGGAALGGAGSAVHAAGNAINRLRPGHTPARFKGGARIAGGLTGMILGGGLGAGVSAMMQQESPAARLMAKMQTGDLDDIDTKTLENLLAATYNKPSQMK